MGYQVLNYNQELRKKYLPRKGLEGPFFYPNGRVTYYDPSAGMYWDPTTDFYLSYEEQSELQNQLFDMIRK
jgi:CCR4-NOT transcriptional regulation complex NOT5 subunit